MSSIINKHIYPVIDLMMERAEKESRAEGDCISCKKGCNHCCYLLVEISWDEAEALVSWLKAQPEKIKRPFLERIQTNAKDARAIFERKRKTRQFMEPVDDDSEMPEAVFEEYFYKNTLPCPILDKGVCGAYAHRPSPCRLHVVTSPSGHCSQAAEDEEIEVPQVFEDVRDDISPVLSSLSEDPRWGQLGIMVEAVLKHHGEL